MYELYIGNKNYSSWSLRPWMLMKHLGVEFTERQIILDTPTFKDEIAKFGPSGRVPVLKHGDATVWDSLAICEYLAEITGRGWPKDQKARAFARSVRWLLSGLNGVTNSLLRLMKVEPPSSAPQRSALGGAWKTTICPRSGSPNRYARRSAITRSLNRP